MKRTKPGKATRVDEVCPELLRADKEEFASRLTKCYSRLWETEASPKVWKKGPVKVFNKGDLRECNNLHRAVNIWNNLDKDFKQLSLPSFKKKLKTHMLENYFN